MEPTPERAYRRREPEHGALHRILSEHLATFLARTQGDPTRPGLPRFVRRELFGFLRCGLLAHGFARLRCDVCARDTLVAFSCKGRGFCPSCGGRRMAERAAHLVDHVLPAVPVRQWVLSLPWRVRYLLSRDRKLCAAVRRNFLRAVFASYRERARRAGVPGTRTGAVNALQRFGSALNLNVHFHALVLDGVYDTTDPLACPVFHELPELEAEEVQRVVRTLRDRVLRLLVRRGLWPNEDELEHEEPPESLLPFLDAASIQGLSALEPGHAPERIAIGPKRERDERAAREAPLSAAVDGFSLHAGVRVEARDRERLEHLCRYVTRPPIATERLSLAPDGRVTYRLRHAWRDGTTHVVFPPLAFLERLAALIPHPRAHLMTYHGVLAPAADVRHLIVPGRCEEAPQEQPEQPAPELVSTQHSRYRWAELLRRVFDVDVLRCEHCGGKRKLLALIQDPFVVRRILAHLGLPTAPTPIAPARAPPQGEFAFP